MSKVTREIIIDTVREWSLEEQVALLKEFYAVMKFPATDKRREPTYQRALGIAATGKQGPDDETVDQWRQERLEEKYG